MNFKSIKKTHLIFGVILGAVLSVIVLFSYDIFLESRDSGNLIDTDTYQAVFLSNNQIYFGHLINIDSQYPVLADVYYVRLEGSDATSGRLVRLGEGEPHGPKNEMIINRDHILFWENLNTDSKIVQTILNLKINQ